MTIGNFVDIWDSFDITLLIYDVSSTKKRLMWKGELDFCPFKEQEIEGVTLNDDNTISIEIYYEFLDDINNRNNHKDIDYYIQRFDELQKKCNETRDNINNYKKIVDEYNIKENNYRMIIKAYEDNVSDYKKNINSYKIIVREYKNENYKQRLENDMLKLELEEYKTDISIQDIIDISIFIHDICYDSIFNQENIIIERHHIYIPFWLISEKFNINIETLMINFELIRNNMLRANISPDKVKYKYSEEIGETGILVIT